MPPEKPSFGARDPSPFGSDALEPGSRKYTGAERRRDNRRKNQDRRGDVRFDLAKSDRREKPGRREDDQAPKFW